jgi:hypothetical protein
VTNFSREKEMASELRRLRRQVHKLREEIVNAAIPARHRQAGPDLPTEPERRLRPMQQPDRDKRR